MHMAEVGDSVTVSESQPLVSPKEGSPAVQRGRQEWESNKEVCAWSCKQFVARYNNYF